MFGEQGVWTSDSRLGQLNCGVAEVLIALGSNVGDSLNNLRVAAKMLESEFGPLMASQIYRTAPMYVEDQPPFLNAAVSCSSLQSPRSVLATLKRLEQEIGRAPRERNGPREIDLDLVAYGRLSYQFMEDNILKLTVPHPAIPERRFVLQPLNDIVPNTLIPGLGVVSDLLARTELQRDHVITLSDALL